MHQHPRPTPRNSFAASNPAANPERTNNQREAPPHRTRSSVDLASYTERVGGESAGGESSRAAERSGDAAQLEREQTKLNQIIQNFHTKAALTICSSRASLPQTHNKSGDLRQNRWFNLVLDETDVLVNDEQEWRRPDLVDDRPSPMVIEVYLDTSHLTLNQALVITDESGKRWDVADALPSSGENSPNPSRGPSRHAEVILERWTVQLGDAAGYSSAQLNDVLPNVYKKGVVLFRSLFTFARFLPAWKLHRRIYRQSGSSQTLRLRFRIRQGRETTKRNAKDGLSMPLNPSDTYGAGVTETHEFEPLLCPAGPLSIKLEYRTNCDFSTADSEALLSSRFAGLDASLSDRPGPGGSLPGARPQLSATSYSSASERAEAARRSRVAGGGAYGSLGTFHAAGKRASPVSALRALTYDDDSDGEGEKSRLRGGTVARTMPTRQDSNLLKNPPFKAGSVATSPRTATPMSPSTSLSRTSSLLAGTSAPKRVPLNALPQQALRTPAMAAEQAIASSGSSSPKPAPVHRYSSSFANRKRFASQSSKAAESNTSSGRASSSSKEKSGQLNEGTPGSSGSVRTDEDDIAAFISSVEKAKDLKAFTSRRPAAQNTINLSKFKGMNITSSELADEMSSSSLIQTSLTPPSRRLSNVPGLSTSSSPSRALAHTPHVRSRLSTHSIAEGKPSSVREEKVEEENADDDDDDDEPFIFQQDNIL